MEARAISYGSGIRCTEYNGVRRNMKIAFISQGLGLIDPPKAYGSISIWTYEIINELKKTENIIAYEMDGGRLKSRMKQHEGVRYIYAPTMLNSLINRFHQKIIQIKKLFYGKKITPIFASSVHNFGYILWVALNLRKQACDVIHIHQFSQYVQIVRFFNRKSKIILHMNCEWLSQLDPEMIEKRLEHADVVVGCSNHILRKILERFPKLKNKCAIVFNGADMGLFVPSEDTHARNPLNAIRILFVGRISPEKGVHVLLEAFKILVEQFPTAVLELAGGTGSMPEEFLVSLSDDPLVKGLKIFYCRDYLADLKSRIPDDLAERITFHGKVTHRDLLKHYSRATVFVAPSFSDAFPLTVVEAMAAGLPVVASAVGGIQEAVIDETTGLLVTPNSPEALASALSRILGDSGMRQRMGAAGRNRALEMFSWRAIANQIARVYGALVESEKAGIQENMNREEIERAN